MENATRSGQPQAWGVGILRAALAASITEKTH
jgi:hypothetical protein